MHYGQIVRLKAFVDYLSEAGIVLFIFRKKNHSDAITPFLWDRDSVEQNKLVRNLYHNAGTVTGL